MSDGFLDEVHTEWVVFKKKHLIWLSVNVTSIFFFW